MSSFTVVGRVCQASSGVFCVRYIHNCSPSPDLVGLDRMVQISSHTGIDQKYNKIRGKESPRCLPFAFYTTTVYQPQHGLDVERSDLLRLSVSITIPNRRSRVSDFESKSTTLFTQYFCIGFHDDSRAGTSSVNLLISFPVHTSKNVEYSTSIKLLIALQTSVHTRDLHLSNRALAKRQLVVESFQ